MESNDVVKKKGRLMKAVFFGEQLNQRAPQVMGVLCSDPQGQWVTLADVVAALRSGESVSIRQASATEMKRAEGVVALYDVGKQLGYTLGSLLDGEDPKVATAAVTEIRDAAESALGFKSIPTDLLDKAQGV